MEDENLPSFFDIIAQESLRSAFPDFLQYLLKTGQSYYPENKLLKAAQTRFEEVYLILDLAVEYLFLLRHHGTLAENYYGLQRCNAAATAKPSFTKLHLYLSLIETVLVPYLVRKLNHLFRQLDQPTANDHTTNRFTNPLCKRLFVCCYPILHAGYEGVNLAMRLAHILHRYPYFSLFMRLAKLTYIHAAPIAEAQSIGFSIPQAISGLMVLIRFLQWWQEQSGLGQSLQIIKSRQSIPLPPPTCSPIVKKQPKNKCPICLNAWTEPTCLYSGLVYCRQCIEPIILSDEHCPITKVPASLEELRPISI